MPGSDLQLLTEAARAAGDIARRFWRKSPEVWDKGGEHGPVTEADLAVNAMLQAELGAARPGYGWLSEETPDNTLRLAAERVFIVDPIDGTRAFIAGDKTFAHSLALAEGGKVVAAAIYVPMHEALYTAGAEGPALLNGRPIRAATRARPEGATLLTSKSTLAPEHWRDGVVPEVRREFRASIAYRLCLVAEGAFDAMMSLRPTWEWDVAAGDLIASRAGARVSDRKGRPIVYNAKEPRADGIIAAAPPLHEMLRGGLKQ